MFKIISRGQLVESPLGVATIATVHPSAVLRNDDRAAAMSVLKVGDPLSTDTT